MRAERLFGKPIIMPESDESIGDNINGPSMIKVPEWVENPLGKYYIYFAHHNGKFIRLAYSDEVGGPWKIYVPGTLHLSASFFDKHIASPEIYIDNDMKQLRMYYHGNSEGLKEQCTRLAISDDGINFSAMPKIIGTSYWRVFKWQGYFYALAMSGRIYRSLGGFTSWEEGPLLFKDYNIRHSALKLVGDTLYVFYSMKGDCPECIVASKIRLTDNWQEWKETKPEVVLEPEMDYEGGLLPLEPSKSGLSKEPVRQLRDPDIFVEGDNTYLLYSVAGEKGIAIAELYEV